MVSWDDWDHLSSEAQGKSRGTAWRWDPSVGRGILYEINLIASGYEVEHSWLHDSFGNNQESSTVSEGSTIVDVGIRAAGLLHTINSLIAKTIASKSAYTPK